MTGFAGTQQSAEATLRGRAGRVATSASFYRRLVLTLLCGTFLSASASLHAYADGGTAAAGFGGTGGLDSSTGAGGNGGNGSGGGGGGAGTSGGNGGLGFFGNAAGGPGGVNPGDAGGEGQDTDQNGGGGGGGAHGFVGSVLPGAAATGGDGGEGGTGGRNDGAGGGGAGGYGAVVTGSGQLGDLNFAVQGGDGGDGGDANGGPDLSPMGFGGNGGTGGIGLVFTSGSMSGINAAVAGGHGGAGGLAQWAGAGGAGGQGISGTSLDIVVNGAGTVTGGDGGEGGEALPSIGSTLISGAGGAGGRAIEASNSGITNFGSVTGGNGGDCGAGTICDTFGSGGEGIAGSNLTVINSAMISGGLSGDGVTQANAITFTGGVNRLELRAGSLITGNVQAASTDDTLRLGGASDSTFDLSQIGPAAQYRGFEFFEKRGASTWTMVGQGTEQVADWAIHEGTMLMSAGSDLGDGVVDIFGGTLAGIGTVGPTTLHQAGTIAPGINGLGTLTIDGDYTGEGGLLTVETVLGGDNSPTDVLVIKDDSEGNTRVRVTNVGGRGAQTNEGIKIVDVGGSSSDGVFSLLGDVVLNGRQAVIGDAYAYSLFQGTPGADDGDWYLRSIGFTPSATAYESYPGILLGLIEMPTLQQRVGNVYMPGAGSRADGYVNPEPAADVAPEAPPPANFWTRFEAAYGHHEGDSDTGTEYDLDRYRVQVGVDGRMAESDDGIFVAGINAQYGHADADLESDTGDGDNSTDSYGGGLTLTWISTNGFYADAQAMAHYLESDLSSDVLGDLTDNNEGWGYGLSLELGRKLSLDDGWSVTPQAQLAYTSVDFDDFTDPQGLDVSLDKGESLEGRLGLALNYDSFGDGDTRGHVYGIANLTYEFLDAQAVEIAGVDVEFEPEDFGGELGLGGTYEWAGGKYAVHGEALGQTSFEGSYGVKGTAGFSTRF